MGKKFMLAMALLMASFQINAQCANPSFTDDCIFTTEVNTNDIFNDNGCFVIVTYTLVTCTKSSGGTVHYLKNIKFARSESSNGIPCPMYSEEDIVNLIKSRYPNWAIADYSNNFSIEAPCMKYIQIVPNQADLAAIMDPANGCFTNVCEPTSGSTATLAFLVPCSDNICCDWDASTNTFNPSPACVDNGKYNPGPSLTPWVFLCSSGNRLLRYTILGDLTPCGPWCSLTGLGNTAGNPTTKLARYVSNTQSSNSNQFEYILSDKVIKLTNQNKLKEFYIFDFTGKVLYSYRNDIPAIIDLSKMSQQILIITGKDLEGNSFSSKVMMK